MEVEKTIECRICGKKFARMTPQHLKKHGYTSEQYKKEFPDAPLSSDEFKLKQRYIQSEIVRNAYDKPPPPPKAIETEDPFDRSKRNPLEDEKEFFSITEIFNDEPDPEVEELEVVTEKSSDKRRIQEFLESFSSSKFKDIKFRAKSDLIKFLRNFFPHIVENYIFKKTNIQGHIEHQFITDVADPIRRVNFEFPNAFWHNNDNIPPVFRDKVMKANGWVVVRIASRTPTKKDLMNVLHKDHSYLTWLIEQNTNNE